MKDKHIWRVYLYGVALMATLFSAYSLYNAYLTSAFIFASISGVAILLHRSMD